MEAKTEVACLEHNVNDDPDAGCGMLTALMRRHRGDQSSDDEDEMVHRMPLVVNNDIPIDIKVYPKYAVELNDELSGVPPAESEMPVEDSKYVYDTSNAKRGKMIIISNKYFLPKSGIEDKPRDGTDFDAENLRATFSRLQFECEIHENKTCAEMLFIVVKASNSQDVNCDCMAFAFLTYGGHGDKIYGIDGWMHLNALLDPLKHGHNMAKFAGKPKLIFIQASQGRLQDTGLDVTDAADEAQEFNVRKIPVEADFLYSHSSAPGYYSFDGTRGSVYIRILCEMLSKHHETTDLLTILTRVNHDVAYEFEAQVKKSNPDYKVLNQKKQMPTIVSTLTKDLYLSSKR